MHCAADRCCAMIFAFRNHTHSFAHRQFCFLTGSCFHNSFVHENMVRVSFWESDESDFCRRNVM
jgi:hypothetical protein